MVGSAQSKEINMSKITCKDFGPRDPYTSNTPIAFPFHSPTSLGLQLVCFGPGSQKIPGPNHTKPGSLPVASPPQSHEKGSENPRRRRQPPAARRCEGEEQRRKPRRGGDRSPVATPPLPAPTRPAARLRSQPPSSPDLMAPPPNAFSNELGQWICNEFSASIVFVELTPRDPADVKALWDELYPIPRNDIRHRERVVQSQKRLCSTGSIIKDANGYIWVLTCAHVLGHAFRADTPITAQKVEELFAAMILCDHREERFKRKVDVARIYVPASVFQISCEMDMMLLRIPKGVFEGYCNQPHRILSIAPDFPPTLQEVAMLSWPPNRFRTAVTGEASHRGRARQHVSASENPFGYRMRLAEVNITSEDGSSGAPLLNGAGNYVAILHGGCGTRFSYFVNFTDLRNTLREWEMVD